jgi:hypothetical protein
MDWHGWITCPLPPYARVARSPLESKPPIPRLGPAAKASIKSACTGTIQRAVTDFQLRDWTAKDIPVNIFSVVTNELQELVRMLERDALALITTAPAEALRAAYLASELRKGVA